jgi:O-antigen ligase
MSDTQHKKTGIRQQLRGCKSVGELVRLVSEQTFERCAFFLLSFLIIIPILIIPFYLGMSDANFSLLSPDEPAYSNVSLNISGIFFAMYDIVGNLGLLLAVFFLIHKFVLREPLHLKKQPWLIALLAVLIISVIATLTAHDTMFALRGSSYRHDGLYTYFHLAAAFCCAYMLKDNRLRLHLIELFSLAVSVTCIITFLQMAKLSFILKKFQPDFASVFHNINHFGYYLVMGISASMILMLLENSRKKQIVVALLVIIQLIALVKNDTFGAYLAVLTICIIIPVLLFFVRRKFQFTTLLPLGMLLTITFIVGPELLIGNYMQLYNDAENLTDASGSGRWILWKITVHAILERPFLGYGPEGMAWIFESKGVNNDRPHNEILQYAASIGIPGLLCYLSALVLLLRKFWKQRRQSDCIVLAAVCAVIAYFGSSLLGNTMYYTSPYFFMLLGIAAGSAHPLAIPAPLAIPVPLVIPAPHVIPAKAGISE